MNSRFIPVAAFALWSIVCWRWYVCGIKQQCGEKDMAAVTAVQADPTYTPPDTFGQAAAQNAIEADGQAGTTNTAPSTTTSPSSNASNTTTQKALTDNIDAAQVVAVADHVLIHFPYGSTRRIDDDAIDGYLSELASALQSSGGKVTLIGHTDNIGDPASNKAMSLDRAKHIRASLIKKGVSAKQVVVKGSGESKPIATNDNPRGRYKNRRVEVRINK